MLSRNNVVQARICVGRVRRLTEFTALTFALAVLFVPTRAISGLSTPEASDGAHSISQAAIAIEPRTAGEPRATGEPRTTGESRTAGEPRATVRAPCA